MNHDVLTTSQAAKLLGISVRTAQLLLESGVLRSWKTPGGHRRVYREDVVAHIARYGHVPTLASSRVLLLVSPARKPLFDALLEAVSEYSVEVVSDLHDAAFAIGVRLPAVVSVDLGEYSAERLVLLRQLTAQAALGATSFIAVTDDAAAAARHGGLSPGRVIFTSLDGLPGALRALSTPTELPAELADPGRSFPIAANESQRLAAVQRSGLLGTAPEAAFDHLTWLACRSLEMPISLMTMLTSTHQWFKSRAGLDLTETPRSWAFCNYTVLQRRVFTIENLAQTQPFASNPAVAQSPHFRFYAGAPVLDPDGFALGSLCVMDYQQRALDPEQEQTLLVLAALTSDEVRLRLANRQLQWALSALER